MKIDCLMGTYGRYAVVCEALACFLQQSALSSATLLIYNQHPAPLSVDHPRVRVVNEPAPAGTLRHIRQRMHELALPDAELIHWWDDDDLYLPWHLADGLAQIGANVAWKPTSSWYSVANTSFSRVANRFEGSWIFRADYLKAAPIDTDPTYTDHPVILQTEREGLLATTELGDRTSYIYRWSNGTAHLSSYGASPDQASQRANIETWRGNSRDTVPDGRLVPADLTRRWQQFVRGVTDMISAADLAFIRQHLEV
ncbi:MAG: hypothetical protein ACLP1D_00145 [Xanthobacteraceae bacterium]